MVFTDAQLADWLHLYLSCFTRLGAALMVAPLIGTHAPMRARLLLTVLLTLLIAPLLPPQPAPDLASAAWLAHLVREFLVGIALGFALRLCFEAVMLAGELIANSMGLGFAQMADPVRGTSPVVGQFLFVLAALSFLALGGHLLFIELLAQSFAWQGAPDWPALVLWAGRLFSGALSMALPALMGLLLVNLMFGVISRAAPTLNLMAVGFPLALAAGLVLLALSVPGVMSGFTESVSQTFDFLRGWLRV